MLNIKKKRQLNILKKISLVAITGIFLSIFLVNSVSSEEDTSNGSFVFTVIMDSNPPIISHTPVKLINIVGNKVVIEANVTDDMEIVEVSLYYKKHSDTEYEKVTEGIYYIFSGSSVNKDVVPRKIFPNEAANNYNMRMDIPPEVVTTDGVDYYITATDNAGNTSCYSGAGYSRNIPSPVVPIEIEVNPAIVAVTITSAGGTIVLRDGNPEDGQTQLTIPPNALSEPTEIIIRQIVDMNEVSPGSGAAISNRPVAAYEFSPDGLVFNRASTMSLLYFDIDHDGIVDGTNIAEEELRIFWWDGYDWRYVGGKIDRISNIVTTEIMHFCIYALFPARQLAADDYRPKTKIITPATPDGINDVAEFEGLSGKRVTIKIFDITGKRVRTISSEPYEWDGRDDEERLLESGVYIYQLDVDGELISGMIAVAK